MAEDERAREDEVASAVEVPQPDDHAAGVDDDDDVEAHVWRAQS